MKQSHYQQKQKTAMFFSPHANLFNAIDVDRSRTITKREFTNYYRKTSPVITRNEVLLNFMFDLIDDDKSGKISPKEFEPFAAAYTAVNPKTEEDWHKVAFKMLDADGSGFIERAEMKRLIEAFGCDATEGNFRDFLKMTDQNGDGKMDFKEFAQLFTLL